MASQFSHLQFFRRVPNAFLAKYFASRGAVLDVAHDKLKHTEVDAKNSQVQLADTFTEQAPS